MSAKFGCLSTAIGSMPHTDPEEACSVVMKYLPAIPVWPQLPQRSPKEKMYIQFSEGFPGIVLNGDKVHIQPPANFDITLEQVYSDSQEENFAPYSLSPGYAAGFHAFLVRAQGAEVVKGQITGPITFGLAVTGEKGLAILYDETLAELVAKFLRLKALWQENALRKISPRTIIFVDEPYLVSLGSVFTPIPEKNVVTLLEEVFKGIKGLKGLHCCGNTNWPVLLDTSTDILSFDAYNYASSLGIYPKEVKSFLAQGKAIAWGIVPNDEDSLAKESVSSLYDRLGEAMAPFTRDGISFKQIVEQGLLTPSCGLAGLSPEAAIQVLELLANLSDRVRKTHGV